MADKIKCSECRYCGLYTKKYGYRKACYCDHPDQEYIQQFHDDHRLVAAPGFIGYSGFNDDVVPVKLSPRWCSGKKGSV